jgi:hypothetical protein
MTVAAIDSVDDAENSVDDAESPTAPGCEAPLGFSDSFHTRANNSVDVIFIADGHSAAADALLGSTMFKSTFLL